MGEIADMHVEAFEAGLDPNEMDGAEWADFYEEQPTTIEDSVDDLGVSARMLLCEFDDLADKHDFSAKTRAETLTLYLPKFGKGNAETLVRLLMQLSEDANAEGDRLRAESSQ